MATKKSDARVRHYDDTTGEVFKEYEVEYWCACQDDPPVICVLVRDGSDDNGEGIEVSIPIKSVLEILKPHKHV